MADQADEVDTLGYESPDVERPASAATSEQVMAAEARPDHDPYAALRLPDFRLYLLGWVVSVIGQQILDVAIGWDIFNRTTAEANINPLLALGLVGGVLAGPIIGLAIPAGLIADRFDRRLIIMVSLLGAGLSSLELAWFSHHHAPLAVMYACLFVFACFSALGWPARSALLPQLVPGPIFTNAVTWNSSAYQIASMAGPALGGLVLYWSTPLAYVLDACFLFSFAAMVMSLKVKPAVRAREPLSLSSVAAGLDFVFRNKIILATITLDLFAVLFGGCVALLPAFAKDILHAGSGGYGLLRAAPAVGALLMGVWMAHRRPMKRAGVSMLWAVAGFGLATIAFGLSHNFWLSFLMLLLTGACDNVSVVVRHTLVQILTPDAMRGRVSAVNNIFIGASNELGGFESGLTGAWLGAVRSVVYGGIGTIIVVMTVARLWPEVIQFGSLQDAAPAE